MDEETIKYVNITDTCEDNREDEYFIEPDIIKMILFDALKLSDIEEFINKVDITITEDEIKTFLNKKMIEENPNLKQKEMEDIATAYKYYFEPYSLQYFKKYTSILKKKCQSLLSVLNDINKGKSEKLSDAEEQRLLDLDFHIDSEGNINFKDAERLLDAIIYNVKDLSEKIALGNNPETYLTFKESKHKLGKDDVWENEIYPSSKIQIKDRYYAHMPEFIALSEAQFDEIRNNDLKNFLRWLEDTADEYEDEKSVELQKIKK